jgi:phage gpG-like protein
MITVEMVGTEQAVSRLEQVTPAVVANVQRSIAKLGVMLQRHVVEDKLSGQVLQMRTGTLRRSIIEQFNPTADGASAVVRATKIYGRIHEYGGVTPPHVIEPKTPGGVLAFQMGGKTIFARRVNHPGSKIPERSFLRSALRDMVENGQIRDEIQAATDAAVTVL